MLQTALPLGVCSACGVPEGEKGKQAHRGLGLGSCHTAEDVPVLWSLAYQKVKYLWCPTWIPISSASVTHAGALCLIGKAATLSCFGNTLMKKPDIRSRCLASSTNKGDLILKLSGECTGAEHASWGIFIRLD